MERAVSCEISKDVLDLMSRLQYILDYTNDGFVLHDGGAWLPLSDVLEDLFLSEKEIRDEESSSERRRETEEKEEGLSFP